MDAKIKKQGRIDFATRTILKAMLSALDNDEHPKSKSPRQRLEFRGGGSACGGHSAVEL